MSIYHHSPQIVNNHWDYELNTEDPKTLSYGSAKKVFWKCKEGCGNHKWEQSPNVVTCLKKHNTNICPICAPSNGALCPCKCNSFGKKSHAVQFWNYARNNKTPFDYLPASNAKVWWKCPKKCGYHEWETTINSVSSNHNPCQFCSAISRVCPCKCNSFASQFPHLLQEWDYENNDKAPDEITTGSGYKALWKCDKGCGNHTWQVQVRKRSLGSKCPICLNQKICPCKCNTIHGNKNMSILWDRDKNTDDARSIAASCKTTNYWWKCTKECGNHSWMAKPCDITEFLNYHVGHWF
jgi:hypothetical protein